MCCSFFLSVLDFFVPRFLLRPASVPPKVTVSCLWLHFTRVKMLQIVFLERRWELVRRLQVITKMSIEEWPRLYLHPEQNSTGAQQHSDQDHFWSWLSLSSSCSHPSPSSPDLWCIFPCIFRPSLLCLSGGGLEQWAGHEYFGAGRAGLTCRRHTPAPVGLVSLPPSLSLRMDEAAEPEQHKTAEIFKRRIITTFAM